MQNQKRSRWAWALYDAGNSAFATVIMAGFFPVFFKTYWSSGSDVTVSTFRLGVANSVAGLLIAVFAPLLGAFADKGLAKKRFLGVFAGLGIAASAALFFVQEGNWPYAAAIYVAGVVGFSGANTFYDSLLPSVGDKKTVDQTSALGFSLGYLGGGIIFAFFVWMVLSPETFGHVLQKMQKLFSLPLTAHVFTSPPRVAVIRCSFLLTAVWWALFTIPLMFFVPEPKAAETERSGKDMSGGLNQLFQTFRETGHYKSVWIFLLAYWFYIDGVNTVIRMAVDYGMSLGLEYSHLICALLITQFVGFPSALLFGRLGKCWGTKNALYAAIAGYLIIVLWAMAMTDKAEFYLLAVMVGLVQGGIQALSRSCYSRMIPQDKAAQFFGFYNMAGKSSVIFGPAIMGITGYLSHSPRAGIGILALFFITGGILLCFVDEKSLKCKQGLNENPG